MADTTNTATDQTRRRRKMASKDAPRLRQGVMKRGNTWSYVIRVNDPETGVSKPRWVGGFATEEAARDESRVKARRGEYVDRNRITVAAYLDDWIDSHAMEIKPRTLQDYRARRRLYVTPRIGHLQVQAVRPSTISQLYRDLLTSGGRQPLAVATVTHLHAVLRKAFRDAVIVDEIITSNTVERAKRPRAHAHEAGTVWTVAQLRGFLATAQQHRLFAFFHIAAYTGARRGELVNLRWTDVDLDGRKITTTGSTAVIAGERVNGTTKSGRTRVVSIDDETVSVLRQHKADQAADQLHAGDSWRGVRLRVHDRLGRADLPRHRDLADHQAHRCAQRPQAQTPAAARPAARPTTHPRHSLPVSLLSGVPVHVVAARLGHADPAITLRVYAHSPFHDRKGPLSWEPPIGIEPMTYALRGCHGALLAGSEPALASCSQVATGGDRWLLMAVRGHLGGTRP
jgi:integrase